jgi:hypothetical protein
MSSEWLTADPEMSLASAGWIHRGLYGVRLNRWMRGYQILLLVVPVLISFVTCFCAVLQLKGRIHLIIASVYERSGNFLVRFRQIRTGSFSVCNRESISLKSAIRIPASPIC